MLHHTFFIIQLVFPMLAADYILKRHWRQVFQSTKDNDAIKENLLLTMLPLTVIIRFASVTLNKMKTVNENINAILMTSPSHSLVQQVNRFSLTAILLASSEWGFGERCWLRFNSKLVEETKDFFFKFSWCGNPLGHQFLFLLHLLGLINWMVGHGANQRRWPALWKTATPSGLRFYQ